MEYTIRPRCPHSLPPFCVLHNASPYVRSRPPLGECEEHQFLASPPSMAAGVSSVPDADDRELGCTRVGDNAHLVALSVTE